MKQIVLAVVAVGALTHTCAFGQELSAEAKHANEIGVAAMECGFLAAQAGQRYAGEALRLVTLANYNTLRAMEELTSILVDSNDEGLGPLGGFIRTRSPEFWAGHAFAKASEKINKLIENQYPFGEGSFDAIMTLREVAAEDEFKRRNCSLIRG